MEKEQLRAMLDHRLSRRKLLQTALFATSGVFINAACNGEDDNFVVEENSQVPTAEPTPTLEKGQEVHFSVLMNPLERVIYKPPFGEEQERVANPFGQGKPLTEDTVLVRDEEYTDSKPCSLSNCKGDKMVRREYLFLLSADVVSKTGQQHDWDTTTGNFSKPLADIYLLNSRGHRDLGKYKVVQDAYDHAFNVFHPDQLQPDDYDRVVMTLFIDTKKNSASGKNVRSVINNDHTVVIEHDDPQSKGIIRQVFDVKAPH
jgi:hypothetical protein